MLTDVVDSCLFLTPNGTLLEVFCEFKVLVKHDVHVLKQGDIVMVSAVRHDNMGNIIFSVNSEYYYSSHFILIV